MPVEALGKEVGEFMPDEALEKEVGDFMPDEAHSGKRGWGIYAR